MNPTVSRRISAASLALQTIHLVLLRSWVWNHRKLHVWKRSYGTMPIAFCMLTFAAIVSNSFCILCHSTFQAQLCMNALASFAAQCKPSCAKISAAPLPCKPPSDSRDYLLPFRSHGHGRQPCIRNSRRIAVRLRCGGPAQPREQILSSHFRQVGKQKPLLVRRHSRNRRRETWCDEACHTVRARSHPPQPWLDGRQPCRRLAHATVMHYCCCHR